MTISVKFAHSCQSIGFFLLIACFPINLSASELGFSHLGLPQGSADVLAQDKYGLIWVGTKNGLVRYDGNVVTNYRNDPDDSASLQNDTIIALHSDKAGRLWVGTELAGASYYDYSEAQFVRLSTDVIGKHIYRFFGDDTGQGVFVQTGEGLFFIDKKDEAKLILSTKYSESILGIYSDPKGTHAILETGQKLTLSTNSDQPKTAQVFPSTLSQYWQLKFCQHFIREPTQAGGGSGLFYCLQGDKPVPVELNQILSDAGINPDQLLVYNLVEDDDGIIWISSDIGLLRVAGELVTITKSLGFDGNSLSSNKLSVLLLGQKNNLFIGTQDKGLNILNLGNSGIKHFTTLASANKSVSQTPPEPKNKLCSAENEAGQRPIWSTLKDAEGDLWIGNHSGLAYRPMGSRAFQYHNHLSNENQFIDLCAVWSLAEADDQIWIGTQTGLIAFDKQKQTFVRYQSQGRAGDHDKLSGNSIQVLQYDKKRGSLWIGTNDSGLNRIDLASRKAQHFPYATNDPTALPHNQVRSLYLDRDNHLWIGTSGGLSLWDEVNNTFRTIRASDDATTLSDASIHTIYQSDQNHLWLGTSNGLNLFNINQFKVEKRLFERNGLPNSTIYGFVPDDQGSYWITTANGLSRFDPAKETFSNYYTGHYIKSNCFNINAWHKDKEGLIYLGSTDGLSIINPEKFAGDDKSYPPLLTSVEGFNGQDKSTYLAQMLSPTDNRPIKSLLRNIRLNFTYPFFGDSDLLKSQYRLLPNTQTWSETFSGSHYVDYSNLAPGHYEFQLRANLAENQVSSFKLTIEPYFWETDWFKVLSLIMMLALTVFLSIYCYRLWSKFSAEKLARQHYHIVEHELRPHLHAANKQLKILLESPQLAAKEKQLINTSVMPLIAKSTDFVAELRTFVDFRRAAKQAKQLYMLEDVLDEVLLFFIDYEERIVIGEIEDLTIQTHQDAVYLLVKNLTSNALKYSPDGETILLNINRKQKNLIIECFDQGIGISKDKRKAIYEPYKRFTGGYTNISGQGIGLAIVRFIVHTYHGSIQIEDNQPKGCRFTVVLKGVVADGK